MLKVKVNHWKNNDDNNNKYRNYITPQLCLYIFQKIKTHYKKIKKKK